MCHSVIVEVFILLFPINSYKRLNYLFFFSNLDLSKNNL